MGKKGNYTDKDVASMINDSSFYKENFENNKAIFERVKISYETGHTAKRTMRDVTNTTHETQTYLLNAFRASIPEDVRKLTSLEKMIVDNILEVTSYMVNMPPERLIVQQMREKSEKDGGKK